MKDNNILYLLILRKRVALNLKNKNNPHPRIDKNINYL